MKKRKCFVFVFDEYADWEPSLTIAGLQKFSDFAVHTFSVDGKPVRSMGNINVVPDFSLTQIVPAEVDLLLLPGGDSWAEGKHLELIPLVNKVLERNNVVAGICGATAFLAEQGYLNNIRHTSNHLEHFLKAVAPHYQGHHLYEKEHAVMDKNIITANGTASVEFAEKIFDHFQIDKFEGFDFWFGLFKNRDAALAM